MVVGRRNLIAALIAVGAAMALAHAIAGRGADAAPADAARAFIAAARAADKPALWELLGPATRARLRAAAATATDRVGGARRFGPLDVLDVAAPGSSYLPARVVARDVHGAHAFVDVLGPGGRHDVLDLVHVDGRWRVEIDFPRPPAVRTE